MIEPTKNLNVTFLFSNKRGFSDLYTWEKQSGSVFRGRGNEAHVGVCGPPLRYRAGRRRREEAAESVGAGYHLAAYEGWSARATASGAGWLMEMGGFGFFGFWCGWWGWVGLGLVWV